MEDIFGVTKIPKKIIGVLEMPDIFFLWTVDAVPKPKYEEKMIVPPLWDLSISSNLTMLNAYKWAFVLVGFCPSGLLS